jgi:hypothetical protein
MDEEQWEFDTELGTETPAGVRVITAALVNLYIPYVEILSWDSRCLHRLLTPPPRDPKKSRKKQSS